MVKFVALEVNNNSMQTITKEWAVLVYDDRLFFEMLILEGAQAGLNWYTVLKKRIGYRQAFHNFIPKKVANMKDEELEKLRENPAIIRNRLKIYAARKNALVFLEIQKIFGSFSCYLWQFVAGKPIVNSWKKIEEMPATSKESDQLSKEK